MIQLFTKRTKNNKGFTLVELIVVIAILGILVAIAAPRLQGFTDTAKKQADISNAKLIANMLRVAEAEGNIRITTNTIQDTDPYDGIRIYERTGDNAYIIGPDRAATPITKLLDNYMGRVPVSELTGENFNIEFNGGNLLISVGRGRWEDVVYPFPATHLHSDAGANWR